MECYRCNNDITDENASDEHIILNACGGRLKSKNLLCKSCNSIFGDKFDFELAKSTNELANLLLIKRHGGKPQPIKTVRNLTGDNYYLEYGGSPIQAKTNIKITKETEEKRRLQIDAKNRKELEKTLTGLKRKYPSIDVDAFLNSAQEKRFYINDSFQINAHIGGKEEFKSIAKTAINFFIYKGGDSTYIKHLLPYLEGKENRDVVWMHYPDNDIFKPLEGEVTHVLKIIADPKEHILYAYVELFNVHCFIVRLNEEYDGMGLDADYIFNVHSYETFQNLTKLKLTKNQLNNLFESKNRRSFDKLKEKYVRVLNIANKKQDKFQLNEIISNAVDNSIGLLPEGTVIDKEIMAEMFDELMKSLMPFIAHRNNLKNID